MLLLYNLLLGLATLFLVPYYGGKMLLTGKYRKGLGQRLGFRLPEAIAHLQGSPRLWIHAVSVGEVTAAAPIIASLRESLPGATIVLSTTTETGQAMARRIVTGADACIYYPLDLPFAVRRVITAVRPDVFVLTETELWPNFIKSCQTRKIKIVMANGRLSPRSFRRYARTRFFWRGILSALDAVGAISERDAERFRLIGLPPGRLSVTGNTKYDSLAARASAVLEEEMRGRLAMGREERVLVAGSTHAGEEEIVLALYGELLPIFPDLKLIIVPRHVERAALVHALVREKGFADCLLLTEIAADKRRRHERVIIVDVIGELFPIYSLATVVFCGGSLVPKGGQNILEAAAWGKVIFYGPFMDDFQEERSLLEEAGAGVTVRDREELQAGVLKMLADPEDLARRGEAGRRLVAANRGAAGRNAALIMGLLPSDAV